MRNSSKLRHGVTWCPRLRNQEAVTELKALAMTMSCGGDGKMSDGLTSSSAQDTMVENREKSVETTFLGDGSVYSGWTGANQTQGLESVRRNRAMSG